MPDKAKVIDLVVKVALLVLTTVFGWYGISILKDTRAEVQAQTVLMRGHP